MNPLLVVKLGGSLLDWPAWPARLADYLATRPEVRPVLVVGGGRFADVLRDLDPIHTLGEARSHALALHVLDTTAHLAAALVPGSVVVHDRGGVESAHGIGQIPIFAPRIFLGADDHQPDPLPHAWTTTTDSIAARLAWRLGAAELILLKSRPQPPDVTDWEAAARLGLVDPEFPREAARLARVSIVSLRGTGTHSAVESSSSRSWA